MTDLSDALFSSRGGSARLLASAAGRVTFMPGGVLLLTGVDSARIRRFLALAAVGRMKAGVLPVSLLTGVEATSTAGATTSDPG
jgi:hypothetical protein